MLLLLMIWQTYNDSHKCISIFPANSVAAVNFLQEKRSESYTLLLVLLRCQTHATLPHYRSHNRRGVTHSTETIVHVLKTEPLTEEE
jgi:hypothetical protein